MERAKEVAIETTELVGLFEVLNRCVYSSKLYREFFEEELCEKDNGDEKPRSMSGYYLGKSCAYEDIADMIREMLEISEDDHVE